MIKSWVKFPVRVKRFEQVESYFYLNPFNRLSHTFILTPLTVISASMQIVPSHLLQNGKITTATQKRLAMWIIWYRITSANKSHQMANIGIKKCARE